MKLYVNNKTYIQALDINFILDNYNNIPDGILKYENHNLENKYEFFEFNDLESTEFIDSIDMPIYADYAQLEWGEIYTILMGILEEIKDYAANYQGYRIKRPIESHSKGTNDEDFLSSLLTIINEISYYRDAIINNCDKYPIELRLLIYKFENLRQIGAIINRQLIIDMPEGSIEHINYSNKQLRSIYYEVLGEGLSYDELKPIEKELRTIFKTINYTPEIKKIIGFLITLSRNNDISFIDEEFMNMILKYENKKTKFDEVSLFIMDYIYAVGYKNFSFNNKVMLETDIRRIKRFFSCTYFNDNPVFLNYLSFYNPILGSILKIFSNREKNPNFIKMDMMFNIATCFYLMGEKYDYDLSILEECYQLLDRHFEEFLTYARSNKGYRQEESLFYKKIVSSNEFITNFNISCSLLDKVKNRKGKEKTDLKFRMLK